MAGDLVPLGHNRAQVKRLRRMRRKLARADRAVDQLDPADDRAEAARDAIAERIDAARDVVGDRLRAARRESRSSRDPMRPTLPPSAEVPDVRADVDMDALSEREDKPLYVRDPREASMDLLSERSTAIRAAMDREPPTRENYLRATAEAPLNFGLLSRLVYLRGGG